MHPPKPPISPISPFFLINGRSRGQGRGGGLGQRGGGSAAMAQGVDFVAGVFKGQIDDGSGVEGEDLGDEQAANDRHAQGLPQLGAVPRAMAKGMEPQKAAMVVIMMGRKRMMQAL